MAKPTRKSKKRKRTLGEKLWIAMAIILALSMVVSSIAVLFTS